MTTSTWSTLADRLEALPVGADIRPAAGEPFADDVVLLPQTERDELVAFLRSVHVLLHSTPFSDPSPVLDVVHDQASGRERFCLTCSRERPTYFAGDGGTVRAGTECCATCQRAIA